MNNMSVPTVAILPRSDDATLALRINQRITAEILQVNTDNVLLALDGMPVVAQLSSADQAAELQGQKTAQFIIKGFQDQVLSLQLVKSEQAVNVQQQQPLLVKLLNHLNLPIDPQNLFLAYTMLDEGIPVTAEKITTLRNLLATIKDWGMLEARSVVMLLQSGLPLTHASLQLVLNQHTPLNKILAQLIHGLTQILNQSGHNELLKQEIHQVLPQLDQMVLNWKGDVLDLAEQLKLLVKSLGTATEKHLLDTLQASTEKHSQALILQDKLPLAQLHTLLLENGSHQTASLLERLADNMRRHMFMNAPPTNTPLTDEAWLSLEIPLWHPPDSADRTGQNPGLIKLRISLQQENEKRFIDPQYTHLKFNFDLGADLPLDMDIFITGSVIGTRIESDSQLVLDAAESEFQQFAGSLEDLGYVLKNVQNILTETDKHQQSEPVNSHGSVLKNVDVEA